MNNFHHFTSIQLHDSFVMVPLESISLHYITFTFYIAVIFSCSVIRAPVPWHNNLRQIKNFIGTHLFILNQMIYELQEFWRIE